MIKRIISDIVKYNCDDPEKMVVTKEDFTKATYLFGIRLFKSHKHIEQGFDDNDNKNKIGFNNG